MNWSAVSCLAALMFNLLPQQEKQLVVRIVSEESGSGAEFTAQQVVDAATVILTAKMPDVMIRDNARLTLYIQPTCLSLGSGVGYACAHRTELRMFNSQGAWPFGDTRVTVLWSATGVLKGPPGNALAHLRSTLEELLDEPIAAWRRLTEKQHSCWAAFFDGSSWWTPDWQDIVEAAWKSTIAGKEELAASDGTVATSAQNTALVVAGALWTYGPCWIGASR